MSPHATTHNEIIDGVEKSNECIVFEGTKWIAISTLANIFKVPEFWFRRMVSSPESPVIRQKMGQHIYLEVNSFKEYLLTNKPIYKPRSKTRTNTFESDISKSETRERKRKGVSGV